MQSLKLHSRVRLTYCNPPRLTFGTVVYLCASSGDAPRRFRVELDKIVCGSPLAIESTSFGLLGVTKCEEIHPAVGTGVRLRRCSEKIEWQSGRVVALMEHEPDVLIVMDAGGDEKHSSQALDFFGVAWEYVRGGGHSGAGGVNEDADATRGVGRVQNVDVKNEKDIERLGGGTGGLEKASAGKSCAPEDVGAMAAGPAIGETPTKAVIVGRMIALDADGENNEGADKAGTASRGSNAHSQNDFRKLSVKREASEIENADVIERKRCRMLSKKERPACSNGRCTEGNNLLDSDDAVLRMENELVGESAILGEAERSERGKEAEDGLSEENATVGNMHGRKKNMSGVAGRKKDECETERKPISESETNEVKMTNARMKQGKDEMRAVKFEAVMLRLRLRTNESRR